MMYGDKRVLMYPGLLMDAYHQVCKIHDATKIIFRPEWANLYNPPHFLHCTNPDSAQIRSDEPRFKTKFGYAVNLVHYYAKSVEEFIIKLEQSVIPYIRYLPVAYDHVKQCPNNFTVTYTKEYEETVRKYMEQLHSTSGGVSNGGDFLGPPAEYSRGKLENHDLYLFFKLRTTLRHEWDEEAYLKTNPEVAEAVSEKQWVDGLQEFLEEGFKQGRVSCWVMEESKKRFCLER